MKDAVEMKLGGLKCDNPKCNYNNINIKVEDYENTSIMTVKMDGSGEMEIDID